MTQYTTTQYIKSGGSNPHGLTEAAEKVIKCALADLIGAYQAWAQDGKRDSLHDWASHLQSINDLAIEFDMTEDVPEDLE